MQGVNDGTSGFTSGLQRTIWRSPSLQFPLAGLALGAVAVAFLVFESSATFGERLAVPGGVRGHQSGEVSFRCKLSREAVRS
jgi:hypothetical protein